MSTSGEVSTEAYTDFKSKVKRTVLFDNLSPQVTAQTLRSALSQFGTVVGVDFIPNYSIPYDVPQAALVELETPEQARSMVDDMNNCPFMVVGMPRPVRARLAEVGNFSERPPRPGRKVGFRWVRKGDPDFEVADRLKNLVAKHDAESAALLKFQLQEEEKLAKQQTEMLKNNYVKYEIIEKTLEDGSLQKLSAHYNLQLRDDGM